MKTGYSFGSLVSFVEVLDATTVKITGDQTIAGLKTFSSNPTTSASQGSGGGYLTRKDYVDGKLALKAPLDSPALTGIPTAPTAAVNTDTTQLATTAFVQNALATLVPVEASSANPLMNGVAAAGTSNKYSRGDHVHPTDTSRASLYSPAFSGTPTAPTATAGTDTSQIATTAFVTASNTAQLGTATPLMDGTAAVGTSTLLSRQDHKHPSDTSRAPLSSPALTGTPTAPTATAGTNTTQLATTAFVQSALATIVPVEASSDIPAINGTATAGTSIKYSRGDHVHPTDTSRAPLASPTFTGTPAAPTATAGTNTTQLATTAFVTAANAAQVGTGTPLMNGTAAVGTSTLLSRQDHVHPIDTSRAPIASPAFTGTPTAPTAAAGTKTTQIATTAFVQSTATSIVTAKASSADPLMDGTATAGTSTNYAREGHVHPTDTSRAPLDSPALTGVPTAPTASIGTNTSQLATTSFVTVSIYEKRGQKLPLMDGTAATGTTTIFAREDHVHPTDTSRAPLVSPALTGTPTAPTAAAGTNTTQIATTAFVQAMKLEVAKMLYPVGSYYANDTNSTNPATLFGFGTWALVEGRTLMGCDGTGSGTFGTPGSQGGALTHTHTANGTAITIAQMPPHEHTISMTTANTPYSDGGNNKIMADDGGTGTAVPSATYIKANSAGSGQTHTHTINSASSLPPYRVVYLWRRTA